MAFLGTAYITFICCASKEIIDYKRLVPRAVPLLDKWSSALGGVVVGLSDQQIITGISIIIAGLTQLQRGIGAYQWQPVVNLAWFSAMTHLLKLTTLRNEVRSSMPLRLLRILGIGILILMLICALGPVGYITATEPPPQGFSAWCLYQLPLTWSKVSLQGTNSNHGLDKWDYNWVYVVFTAVLLIYSFCTNVILLSHNITISHHLLRVPRGQPCLLLEQMNLRIQDRRTQHSLYRVAQAACRTFLLSIYQTTHIFHDLYISKIWAVLPLRASHQSTMLTSTDHLAVVRFSLGNFENNIHSPQHWRRPVCLECRFWKISRWPKVLGVWPSHGPRTSDTTSN